MIKKRNEYIADKNVPQSKCDFKIVKSTKEQFELSIERACAESDEIQRKNKELIHYSHTFIKKNNK